MALVKCKECGHAISDTAKNCPNCGAPRITAIGTSQIGRVGIRIFGLSLLIIGFVLLNYVSNSAYSFSEPARDLNKYGIIMLGIGFILFLYSFFLRKREKT